MHVSSHGALPHAISARGHVSRPRESPRASIAIDKASPSEKSRPPKLTEVDTQVASPISEEWSEDEIVHLHWRLLQEVRQLANPATPLEEKLDTLRWVFTDRKRDGLPFSFVNCLRVVGCSPLSPIAYCGLVDAEEVRDNIRHSLRPWLTATLARYPEWVRQAIVANPLWVEAMLVRNPQWINEQMRQMSNLEDMFP